MSFFSKLFGFKKDEKAVVVAPTTRKPEAIKKQKKSGPVGRFCRSYTHYHYYDGMYYSPIDIQDMIYLGMIMSNQVNSYGKTYEEVYPESTLSKTAEPAQEEKRETHAPVPATDHGHTNYNHKTYEVPASIHYSEPEPTKHESHHSSSYHDSSPSSSYDSGSSSYDSGSSSCDSGSSSCD